MNAPATTTMTTNRLVVLQNDLAAALGPAQSDLHAANQAVAAEDSVVVPSPPPLPTSVDIAATNAYLQASDTYSEELTAADQEKLSDASEADQAYEAEGSALNAAIPTILQLDWPTNLQSDVRSFAAAANQLAIDDENITDTALGIDKVATDVANYNTALDALEADLGGSVTTG